MSKRIKKDLPGDNGEERELVQELERLVNENNALLKVLKKITVEKPGIEKPAELRPGKVRADSEGPGNERPGKENPVEPAKKRK